MNKKIFFIVPLLSCFLCTGCSLFGLSEEHKDAFKEAAKNFDSKKSYTVEQVSEGVSNIYEVNNENVKIYTKDDENSLSVYKIGNEIYISQEDLCSIADKSTTEDMKNWEEDIRVNIPTNNEDLNSGAITFEEEETINGISCYKFLLNAENGEENLWISKDDNKLIKIEEISGEAKGNSMTFDYSQEIEIKKPENCTK